MEPKQEEAAQAAALETPKDPQPKSISSGEGAASALSRLRTMEKAEAETGLGGYRDSGDPP